MVLAALAAWHFGNPGAPRGLKLSISTRLLEMPKALLIYYALILSMAPGTKISGPAITMIKLLLMASASAIPSAPPLTRHPGKRPMLTW